MWRTFFAAMTAAFTLQVMNPYFSGNLVVFYANYDHQWHLFEVIPFMMIGAFGVRYTNGGGGRHVHLHWYPPGLVWSLLHQVQPDVEQIEKKEVLKVSLSSHRGTLHILVYPAHRGTLHILV